MAKSIEHLLPELYQIKKLIDQGHPALKSQVLCEIPVGTATVPIHALTLGTVADDSPCIVFTGGIHGLERIGTQVVLAFLETLLARLHWDISLINTLQQLRIVFIPLLNPAGMAANTRANGQGVDLMRNAPIDSPEPVVWLAGGHRISPLLPWYRGPEDSAMELEAQTLCDFIIDTVFPAPFSMVLDCHSGFGHHDRLWFPYAKSRLEPIKHIGEIYYLRELFFQTYPYQNYWFEPQSQHYLTHGDLWDYIYDIALKQNRTFLPLTLEMGSWRWIRKNPRQLFNLLGMFHPIKPHRINRVLRGHLVLMEFLLHATLSYKNWLGDGQNPDMAERAKARWYHGE
ncbi:MAG: zinc carboxypeptidase [Gammaproteobacteria bacterium HGW-Gammaproteobacteria-3]|nr:MAG: zinc carboxypeptidase [Gammaproteobacteria bacterium HGW-Gammaproteobacteria-3]